jgi:hypothetical protein
MDTQDLTFSHQNIQNERVKPLGGIEMSCRQKLNQNLK